MENSSHIVDQETKIEAKREKIDLEPGATHVVMKIRKNC
jgi:hypothetical protein